MLFAAIALAVVAQVKPAPPPQHERRPVVIDLDADIIECELPKPSELLVRERPKAHFESLIKVRKSFEHELLASVGSMGN
jgi:hypothetical protein